MKACIFSGGCTTTSNDNVMTNRREFLKRGTLVAGAIAAEAAFRKAHGLAPLAPPEPPSPAMDAATRDLMMDALNAAKLRARAMPTFASDDISRTSSPRASSRSPMLSTRIRSAPAFAHS
jgi:hypothetical protein